MAETSVRRAAPAAWTDRDLAGTAALAIIVAMGIALRLHNLGGPSFWEDEIASVELARQPLRLLWSDWMVRETNPPLYYTLLHGWMGLLGESEAAVRSLSVLFGGLAIVLTYLLGRVIASRPAGLIAALLCALWSHQVYFSQEARAYIMGVCGVLLAAIGLVGLIDVTKSGFSRGGRLRQLAPWGLYLIGALTAVYSHTTLVLAAVLANLYFAWLWAFRSPRRTGPALAWIAVNLLLVAGWGWWGWITFQQLQLPLSNVSWIPKPSLYGAVNIATLVYGPTGVTLDNSFTRTALQLGGGGLILAGAAWGLTRLSLERAVLLAVFGVGGPLLMFLASQITPIMLPKTLIWAQFSVLTALAVGLSQLPSYWLTGAGLVGMAALLSFGRTLQTPKEPLRELVRGLERQLGPSDVVVVSGGGILIQHYCDKIGCRFQTIDAIGSTEYFNRWKAGLFRGPRPTAAELPALLAGKDRVWSVAFTVQDPAALLEPIARREPSTPFPVALPDRIKVTAWRPLPAAAVP